MNFLKITFTLFIIFALSRFVPHPPNFTSLIAFSFYIPLFFGKKFIPVVLFYFIVTDLFLGFHETIFFTWGSALFISLNSFLFKKNIYIRILGVMSGSLIFYLITNFGVWSFGSYGYSLEGLLNCYIIAIPFYINTLISTTIYSIIIETLMFFNKKYKIISNVF